MSASPTQQVTARNIATAYHEVNYKNHTWNRSLFMLLDFGKKKGFI